MTDNYKKLRDLILKSEGKTLEDDFICPFCSSRKVFKVGSFNHPYIYSCIMCGHDNLVMNDLYLRPITLSRVLLALGKAKGEPFNATIDGGGNVAILPCLTGWKLTENADKQPERTILKLIEILK